MRFRRRFSATMIAVTWIGLVAVSVGQEKTDPPEASSSRGHDLSVESVQRRIKRVEDNGELDPGVKAKILESYAKALTQLRQAADSTARGEQYVKMTREAPEMLQQLKSELAKPISEAPPEIPSDATLSQVQSLLTQAETGLSEAQKSLQALKDEPKRRADLRLEIPKAADAAKQNLQEIDKQLDSKPAPDEPAEITNAAHAFLEARKKAILAEAATAQLELQYFDASGELLSAQRDRAAQRVLENEAQAKFLRTIVNERRRQEAGKQALEASRASAQAHPAVGAIADVNAALANRRQTLASTIEISAQDVERLDRIVNVMDEQFNRISKRYDTAGTTEAIGLLLRKQRDDLPNRTSNLHEIQRRSAQIAETCLELIDDEEKRSDLATIDQRVREIVGQYHSGLSEGESEYLEEEIRRVLQAQRDLYDSLITDTNSYLDNLVEADVKQRQLIAKVDEYTAYCDERILWIRSAKVMGHSDVRHLLPAFSWLFNRTSWQAIGMALWADMTIRPLLTVIALALLALMLTLHRRLKVRIAELGEIASRSNNTAFYPTIWVILISAALALTWPGIIFYLGQALTAFERGSEFVHAIGQGLKKTAIVFATFEVLRVVCKRHGLAEEHFDWNKTTTRLIRSAIWWFNVCALPLILIVTITESQSNEAIKNSLGRVSFLGTLIVLTVCAHLVMRPVGGAFESVYAGAPQAWTSRLRYGWYWLSLLCPVTFGLLSVLGYHYTSIQLAWRLLATFWLIVGLMIVHSTLIRWSLLSYRDLAMKKARERRAAAEAAAATAAAAGAPPTSPTSPPGKTQQEVALSDINKQSRKALQLFIGIAMVIGLWLVWGDIMPALGALRNIELWMVETTDTSSSAGTTTLKPVTLADLLLSIVIASLTITASRNLPSLLEITLLQRLPLDPGVRYAITTVFQYAISAAGIVTSFGVIGIAWSKVQWLVAAIGVGLGFGLQEIFANFISGLILLFEQPVRLGDIVTVGDVSGNVTRIQMRATTITDWDMRELVVPNKEFITSRVMNWTLSSTVSRMSIAVGVEYGTDPDLVRSLLLKIATQNPLVLKNPEPHALLDDFGVSQLNFVLRVYMANRAVYLELRHGMLTEIAREFDQANIKFAFPKCDIQIRGNEASSGESMGEPLDSSFAQSNHSR